MGISCLLNLIGPKEPSVELTIKDTTRNANLIVCVKTTCFGSMAHKNLALSTS